LSSPDLFEKKVGIKRIKKNKYERGVELTEKYGGDRP
jgi:hypothetical protein